MTSRRFNQLCDASTMMKRGVIHALQIVPAPRFAPGKFLAKFQTLLDYKSLQL
jgi:hypothetical protein